MLVSHTQKSTRAKVRNTLNGFVINFLVFFGIPETVYDKKLYDEDIEVIRLYYEKFSKWIVLHNASVLALGALLLAHWDKGLLLKIFLGILFFSSLLSTTFSNRKVNILFNTLLKKQREMKT